MTTDAERRGVARRLLAVAKKLGPNMDAHEFAHYTADVLDVDDSMTWYEMELRLADLIYQGDMSQGRRDTVACDRDALLELAEDVAESAAMAVVMDASKGAKLLADLLLDIARRIREACGEAS